LSPTPEEKGHVMDRPHRTRAALIAAAFAFAGAAHAADPATMKAIRYDAFGPSSVLRYENAPRPVPRQGEVLVKVQAAGVNPIDWKMRKGRAGASHSGP